MRLDKKIVEIRPELSRASAAKLIISGKVKINNSQALKASQSVSTSDKVEVNFQPTSPPNIKLETIYEDYDCVVVDKPIGTLVHSKGNFNPEATVATWLAARLAPSWRHPAGENNARLGIVHRLDRATSGLMICAKNEIAQKFLQKQFSTRKAKKTYLAVIKGELAEKEATINLPIERNPKHPSTFRVGAQGKASVTHYRVIASNKEYSLLELKPTTGRTHQLRVHLKYLGHPIVGDNFYGGVAAPRLMLHASQLEITLPNGLTKSFKSYTPSDFARYLK